MRARFAAAAGAAGVGKVVRGGSAGGGGAGVVRALMAGGGVGGGLRNWRQVVLSAAVGVWATRCKFALGGGFPLLNEEASPRLIVP